jgi:hypothetical protein
MPSRGFGVNSPPVDSAVNREAKKRVDVGVIGKDDLRAADGERGTTLENGRLQELEVDVQRVVEEEGKLHKCPEILL